MIQMIIARSLLIQGSSIISSDGNPNLGALMAYIDIDEPGEHAAMLRHALIGATLIQPSGGDDTSALQAAINSGHRIILDGGVFNTSGDGLTAKVGTQIVGAGRGATTIHHSGLKPFIRLSANEEVQSGFLLSDLTLTAHRGILINSNGLDEANDGVILGVSLQRLFIVGSVIDTRGDDPLWDTTDLLDASGTRTASVTTTAADMPSTFRDIEARHGYAISMTKVFDSTILDVSVRNAGIGWITCSCDINRWIGGRIHECAWFHYDRRGSTFGSQNTLQHVDLLHNRRAGGIAHDGVKFPRVLNCYYECYSDSALWIWQHNVEASIIADNRVDDTWYKTSRITPLMLISSPKWYNKIERNHWQHFTPTSWTQPIIRVYGMASVDGNHPEVLACTDNSVWWPKLRGDDLPGVRSMPLHPHRFAIGNVLYNPGSVRFTLDGAEYSMSTTGRGVFPGAYVQVPSILNPRLFLRVRAKVTPPAPNANRVAMTIELLSHNLVSKQHLSRVGQLFDGFNLSTYTTVEIPLALTEGLARPTDWIRVTWIGSHARFVAVEVSEISIRT
jgi:hypothetical protein